MKIYLLLSCFVILFCTGNSRVMVDSFESELASVTQVYICNSSGAKKYHYKKKCRGLSNCKKEIKEVSLERASELGRTLCGWED